MNEGELPGRLNVMHPSVARQRSPREFFLLVFALAVPFWLLGALVKPPEGFPIRLPLSALQFVCPLIAALILFYREDGINGVRGLLKGVFSYRRIKPKIWYAPIIFLIPTIYLLAYGVMLALRRPLPTEPYVPFLNIPVLFIVFFISAACEEAGWTGYAIDPMQQQRSALQAAVVLGLVWALFHVVADFQGVHDLGWIAWHRFASVMLRILVVWVYNNAGKSVLAAVLLHATDNVSWQLFPNNGSHYDPAIIASITAIAAVIVTSLWGSQTLARFRYAAGPSHT